MTVGRDLLKSGASFTSFSLQKLVKSAKTLSKSPPKLWPDFKSRSSDVDFDGGELILKPDHPILQKLDSCSNLSQFHQMQAQLIVLGTFHHPLAAGRAIKKLSFLPHTLNLAVSLLEKLEEPDAFMCNTIMRRFVDEGNPENALVLYNQHVIGRCIVPNHYTFPLLIKACVDLGSIFDGVKVHAQALKSGFGLDLFFRNSLIRMYSVFSRIRDAEKVFDESSESDLVTWNTMIDGYVKNGQVDLARHLFDEMRERDAFTWNSMLAGYVGIGDMVTAVELFSAMPHRDFVSWNCLIEGCARTGDVVAARKCFDRMPRRNVVSWNTMLALYVRCKEYDKCLDLFDRMIQERETQPNEASLVSVLTACGYLGRIDQGKWVHQYIDSNRRIRPDVLLSTALLTMYIKCGDMDVAKTVFDSMPEKNVVSWNSMIMGYGTHGLGERALEMFMEMGKIGQAPNEATFVCLLAACAHAGMVLEGWWYFDVMRRVYKIEPKVEHYGCMVDLLGRAGLLKDTEELLKKMPVEGGSALWGALLSACHTHSSSQLGEFVAKWLIEKEPQDIGAYLLLSNIYASEGRWEDVDKVRGLIKEKGLHKIAGTSMSYLEDNEPENSRKCGSFHKNDMIYSMMREMGTQVKLLVDDTGPRDQDMQKTWHEGVQEQF